MSALPSPAEAGNFHGDDGFGSEFSTYRYSSSTSEIEEEDSAQTFEIKRQTVSAAAAAGAGLESIREDYSRGCSFSSDALKWEDCVYVGVGKSDSSNEALQWALKNAITTSTTVVYLLHVFPETRYIPSPCNSLNSLFFDSFLSFNLCVVSVMTVGKIPVNQVSKQQVAIHVAQEESKRKDFLQNFIDSCSLAKVKADTVLIESDMVARAILDVIPILNIRKLVLGANKSRKLRSRGGSGIANEILQKAPEFCEVKVVCERKETSQLGGLPSPISSPRYQDDSSKDNDPNSTITVAEEQRNSSVSCMCFKTKFV
ncbi:U-box domain-containing protein 35-like isoform X3 [Cucurbita moschata]|uniref:U-box domain-containing protein 35-like isoform X3 n=1 Tax=Cucurbita moschata TaxID=3662 RepID=A0A6J1EFV0_CUCMO|nr:U-box domain-containing protein 35-like isoform X3 [Cucurbita moschata]